MRFLLSFGLVSLLACSTDTFVGDDGGGTDAGASDASPDVTNLDGGSGDAQPAPNPSALGDKVVLWLMASEAKTVLDAGTLVSSWPDHKNKQTTAVNVGGTGISCIAGLHVSSSPILGAPVVTFCAANLAVTDSSSLQLGHNAFVVEAVFRPTQTTAGSDFDLFAKVPPGGTVPLNGLSLLAPSSSGKLVGSVSSSVIVSSSNSLGIGFQFGGVVRDSSGNLGIRINGNPGPVTSAGNVDVSAQGANVGVGGYTFDMGNVQHVFGGELAELIVANDASATTLDVIESYFQQKYGL